LIVNICEKSFIIITSKSREKLAIEIKLDVKCTCHRMPLKISACHHKYKSCCENVIFVLWKIMDLNYNLVLE